MTVGYNINKSIISLAPAKIKLINIRVDPTELDIVKQFQAIAVGCKIKTTAGTVTVRFNDESDSITLDTVAQDFNGQFFKLVLTGSTTAEVTLYLQPLTSLKRINAIEVQ